MSSEIQCQKVFVYGTLKRGQSNHHWLTKTENGLSQFVCEGRTVQKFPLVIGTRYNIPFLLDRRDMGHQIRGEVYTVDSTMLANLDILENYPTLYDREEQEINTDNGTIKCWLYLLRSFPEKILKRKHLESYSNSSEHLYVSVPHRNPELKSSDDLDF